MQAVCSRACDGRAKGEVRKLIGARPTEKEKVGKKDRNKKKQEREVNTTRK